MAFIVNRVDSQESSSFLRLIKLLRSNPRDLKKESISTTSHLAAI